VTARSLKKTFDYSKKYDCSHKSYTCNGRNVCWSSWGLLLLRDLIHPAEKRIVFGALLSRLSRKRRKGEKRSAQQ